VNNNPIDILVMTIFGIIGYLMTKFRYPHAPLVLAFVLGPIMETSLRQSLIMSDGSFGIFWSSPVSAVIMTTFLLVIAVPIVRSVLALAKGGHNGVAGAAIKKGLIS
jgi:putative tricarboxylic transport membrane protein